MKSLADLKKEYNYRRSVRKMSVQDLRMKLLKEVGRFNNAINNIGIEFDQSRSVEDKNAVIMDAKAQIAYISLALDYLFEKLESL